MQHEREFYIDGKWVQPHSPSTLAVINPSSEAPIARVAMADTHDVDNAVSAARRAFVAYSRTSREERIDLLGAVIDVYTKRFDDVIDAITAEVGAPRGLARGIHAARGLDHLRATMAVLRDFHFEEDAGATILTYEPIGVCALITPWNWPINQISAKVVPGLAAGATMVLKPSEIAPLNAIIYAEILHEAGVPAGVFNLVNGDGAQAGAALVAHPDVDMVSFTGSTRAGIEIARAAAPTVKRVVQELGGKSANIVLADADLEAVISRDVAGTFVNSGQSCNACSRLLVPADRMDEAVAIARAAAERAVVGPPDAEGVTIGPLASQAQFDKVQDLIGSAINDGAIVVTGGTGRPVGLPKGYYVKPTVFAGVRNSMRIAQEEIFGPVITLIGYTDEEEAIAIANDTRYGLSGRVSSGDPDHARRVARRLRTGMVHINGAPMDVNAPFGGYGQSGNGREFGVYGLREFLETKAIMS